MQPCTGLCTTIRPALWHYAVVQDDPTVTIYTDGGCRPNPGPGGWGAVLRFSDREPVEISGSAEGTTNNQMEITALHLAPGGSWEPAGLFLTDQSSSRGLGICNPVEDAAFPAADCGGSQVGNEIEALSVVGIAGPGDPLANPERTFRTFDLIAESCPDVTLCLSTNGLALPDHIERLVERVPEREPIFVAPSAPMYYFLTNRPNPTRYPLIVFDQAFDLGLVALTQLAVHECAEQLINVYFRAHCIIASNIFRSRLRALLSRLLTVPSSSPNTLAIWP